VGMLVAVMKFIAFVLLMPFAITFFSTFFFGNFTTKGFIIGGDALSL